MTIRETIRELQKSGHHITYYERKDGGVLIKTIDGQKFTGATGNLYARALTGQKFSTKRAAQLGRITWSGKRAKSQISSKDIDIKKKLERVQRKWRKAFKGQPGMGRKTAKQVKWSIENLGREETIRRLEEAERYASGKAYTKNIQYLIVKIEEAALKLNSQELQKLADDIRKSAYKIQEVSIAPAYDRLYDLNHGANIQDVVNDVRKILGI